MAAIFLTLEKYASGANQNCEVELSAPGPRVLAASRKNDFEMAVTATIKASGHQLKSRK